MNTRDRMILLLLFFGFAVMLPEIRYEHRFAVQDKETWQSWIPIIYSGLAALGCLIGMVGKKTPRTVAATIFFLGFAVSGVGLYMHTHFEVAKFKKFLMPYDHVYSDKLDANGKKTEVVLNQPLAAPMSLAGLAGVGFLVTSGLFKGGKGKS